MIHEVIIIGSGPTGIASALGFSENDIVPLILDVGHEAHYNPPDCNFYNYRKSHDSFNLMIGKNYKGIYNVLNKRTISPKLNSPYMQFVTKNSENLSPINEIGSPIIQSFSMGGLANAWGAGLYRYLDDELINIPLKVSELSPYYDKLTREIGISGDDDDLTIFFGSTKDLLRPLRLSQKCETFYLKYKKKKKELNDKGIYVGRPRLCVLSQNYNNRTECKYDDLESWLPNLPYVYTPTFTLQRLIKENRAIYHKSVLVKHWTRENNHIIVNAVNTISGLEIRFKCKKLILAAGTINSAKIVLNSKRDFKTKLPLLDNSLIQIPLIFTSYIGSKLETGTLGMTNLNIIIDLSKFNLRLQGSIIGLTSTARALFYEMFPFSAKDNLSLMRIFLPSVLALLLYLPSNTKAAGNIMLAPDNKLKIYNPPYKIDKNILKEIIHMFIRLGIITHPLLSKSSIVNSIHYTGTLPMVENPNQHYHCNKFGEIYSEPGIYVVDGSLFSYIPSKNISFTLMANAMRIADELSKTIKKQ